MRHSCYVLVMTDGESCWARVLAKTTGNPGSQDWEERNLGDLFQEGWRPVRETPMGTGNSDYFCSLLLLEME